MNEHIRNVAVRFSHLISHGTNLAASVQKSQVRLKLIGNIIQTCKVHELHQFSFLARVFNPEIQSKIKGKFKDMLDALGSTNMKTQMALDSIQQIVAPIQSLVTMLEMAQEPILDSVPAMLAQIEMIEEGLIPLTEARRHLEKVRMDKIKAIFPFSYL